MHPTAIYRLVNKQMHSAKELRLEDRELFGFFLGVQHMALGLIAWKQWYTCPAAKVRLCLNIYFEEFQQRQQLAKQAI